MNRRRSRRLRILLSSGEPAGIGPDLCILTAGVPHSCELVVLGDPELLRQRARLLGRTVRLEAFDPISSCDEDQRGTLRYLEVTGAANARCGQLTTDTVRYVLEMLTTGVNACRGGEFDALVTAPVHKGIINDAGIPFTGHTEFIAERTGGFPVMMLATEGLRVALATTHLPLAEVSAAITPERLSAVIGALHRDLVERFGIEQPRILVCGLNPHAGEGGHLGREEITVIGPVLEEFRARGVDLIGPLPADTIFLHTYVDKADAVLAMYHDQGLPVVKFKGFGQAVNITLGLPIIRTSVDHGTALDLAGTGQVDCGSLNEAIRTAIEMAQTRQHAKINPT